MVMPGASAASRSPRGPKNRTMRRRRVSATSQRIVSGPALATYRAHHQRGAPRRDFKRRINESPSGTLSDRSTLQRWESIDTQGPEVALGFGSPSSIGKVLLERFLIAFEAASLLLLVAAVGAVVLAARRKEPRAPEPSDGTRAVEPEQVAGGTPGAAGEEVA